MLDERQKHPSQSLASRAAQPADQQSPNRVAQDQLHPGHQARHISRYDSEFRMLRSRRQGEFATAPSGKVQATTVAKYPVEPALEDRRNADHQVGKHSTKASAARSRATEGPKVAGGGRDNDGGGGLGAVL